MRHAVSLFTTDSGPRPAEVAEAAERAGFATFYVPEHTHIPVRRSAAHPATGGSDLPDDRYLRTLDPWICLAMAAQATSTIRLGTATALPTESDPITLAKTIASLDHLSRGRVVVGAGFGWNTDELLDHGVPPEKRRTVLREYLEAMRALWTQEEAAYRGNFVSFDASWAWPKPVQSHLPVIIGAGGGPKTLRYIADHADGWMTTPLDTDIAARADVLRDLWRERGRAGEPEIVVLGQGDLSDDDLGLFTASGVTEVVWSTPSSTMADVEDRFGYLSERLGLTAGGVASGR